MFEIASIRERLNELAFENGKRAVPLGSVSKLFPERTTRELEDELTRLEDQLSRHDLILERSVLDPDELYVVQTLKYRNGDLSWIAEGMRWVAKITTVALEMVAPPAIGMWLDQRFGTSMLGVIGVLVGVPLGIWHLVKMTRRTGTGGTSGPE